MPQGSLEYRLSSDKTYYICYGIGTETKTDIIVDFAYNGLPVKEIRDRAFLGKTSITSVTVLEGILKIGEFAFESCISLKEIYLPTTLEDLSGNRIFSYNDNLKQLLLGKTSITSLGTLICYSCGNLSTVTLPSTLTSIKSSAFAYCYALRNITFEGTVAQWNAITFGSSWNYGVPATYVTCSDGTVNL